VADRFFRVEGLPVEDHHVGEVEATDEDQSDDDQSGAIS
jgi:hypothetical protein